MKIEKRKVSESRVETIHIVRPSHLNPGGRLFGGTLMQWIDEVGGLVAKRHARSNVITVSLDNLHFIAGAYMKDVIVITGKMTYVGNTSMEIKVESYTENLEGERKLVNRAFVTFVALDEEDKPRKVPELILETEEDRLDWECGVRHRQLRQEREREGV